MSDDIGLLKSRENEEVVDLNLLTLIGRLKTLTLIHTQTFLYSLNASSPKPKKAKKMILEAGRVHQMIIIFVVSWGGRIEVGNNPTREKLLWTFSQLIHG